MAPCMFCYFVLISTPRASLSSHVFYKLNLIDTQPTNSDGNNFDGRITLSMYPSGFLPFKECPTGEISSTYAKMRDSIYYKIDFKEHTS